MKKFLSTLLALIMALSLGISVHAAEGDITITIPDNGHTYKYYQIFTGTIVTNAETNEEELTEIKWGADGIGSTGTGVDAATLEALVALNGTDAANGEAIMAYVSGSGTVFDASRVAAVAPGYYLIEDVTNVQGMDDFVSLYVVRVCKSVTVSPKGDKPEIKKKVKDINDSAGTALTDWQDSADYDIGDTVPFQLTATMPDTFDGYSAYKVAFHDTLSKGLTFQPQGGLTVMIGNNDVTNSFVVNSEINNETGITTLVISCDNILAPTVGATPGCSIVVEFNAVLNNQAVIGSAGNPNEVYLEYSNNPYDETTPSTGRTPTDKVIVFTYKVVVNKADESGAALTGAGFTLYKKDASVEGEDKYVIVGSEITGNNMTTFTWTGLDDGDYKLVETTVPANYNKMEDQFFTVTAEHDVESDDPALTSLSGDAVTGSVIIFTSDSAAGSLTSTIINKSGAVLPETGGVGTTIFYILGSLLVVAAGILLITKKRMASHN